MGEQEPKKVTKRICAGLLAHVDAGKTTLSEALLYTSGQLRRLGRVDHRDAFLDTDELERERGITIFSKQAVLPLSPLEITLLDTPGHVDFSTETERTLQVLDCAVLVISGTDGVQSHTRTLWRLLERYGVPVFLFVNKMDLPTEGREAILNDLRENLSASCVDFTEENFAENAALCGDTALSEYLETGTLEDRRIREMIAARKLFPCFFGSALRLTGVEEFLSGVERFAPEKAYPGAFGAKVYKIARDGNGVRLTYLKVTGGTLRVKDVLSGTNSEGEPWTEKADQLRIYSGEKFRLAEEVEAGGVCAISGLTQTYPGEGLGSEPDTAAPVLQSFLTYQVLLPPEIDPFTAAGKLRILAEEDPALHVVWNEQLGELHVQLMGEVQLEVLQKLIFGRFGMHVGFGAGSIVYRETLAAPVEGMGHFEPLRHYAEVHLLLEPAPRGHGIRLASAVSEDELDRNWQRLIFTHLTERDFPGVLTGSPLTDVQITLTAGRAHLKHTEGGDFRQATYRAVRHGLLRGESILLEPWYDFRLEVPAQHIGRALSDMPRLFAEFQSPETAGERSVITGSAPVSTMNGYAQEVTAYTHGLGSLSFLPKGYFPCHNPEEVIRETGYDAEHDLANPGDSVFCSHGAGFIVPWREAEKFMHLESGKTAARIAERWEDHDDPGDGSSGEETSAAPEAETSNAPRRQVSFEADNELRAIFERTYGPIKRRDFRPQNAVRAEERSGKAVEVRVQPEEKTYLLVDGYNIIHAWDALAKVAEKDLDTARQLLMDLLCNYQSFSKTICILVFDAYRVPRDVEDVMQYHNITVVFTKQAETADTYIERATYEIAKKHKVKVATADYAEQMIVFTHGAQRMSAAELTAELEAANKRVHEAVEDLNTKENAKFINRPLSNL